MKTMSMTSTFNIPVCFSHLFLLFFLVALGPSVKVNLSIFAFETVKIDDVQTNLQNNGKGFLDIGSYILSENGSKCQVLTTCQQCRKNERYYKECKQTGKVQKASCSKTDIANGKRKYRSRYLLNNEYITLEKEKGKNNFSRNLYYDTGKNDKELEEDAEKRDVEEWLKLDTFDNGESFNNESDYKEKEKTFDERNEKKSDNTDEMQKDVNGLISTEEETTFSNESIEEDIYEIYIPCFHTASEDIVALVRFQSIMAIVGGIAMYMVRKQSMQSLSLFERRKLQTNQNSG